MLPIPFGNPSTYPGHSGVDFPQSSGTRIPASGNGTVTFRGWLNDRAGGPDGKIYGIPRNSTDILVTNHYRGAPVGAIAVSPYYNKF